MIMHPSFHYVYRGINISILLHLLYSRTCYEHPLLWAANLLWEATWQFPKMTFPIQINHLWAATCIDPWSADNFSKKTWSPKGFFQFEIIINVLVSSFWFIWIPVLWVYGHHKYFYCAGIDFSCQNMTSTNVRFWRLKLIPALWGLKGHFSCVTRVAAHSRFYCSTSFCTNTNMEYIIMDLYGMGVWIDSCIYYKYKKIKKLFFYVFLAAWKWPFLMQFIYSKINFHSF